MDIKKLSSVPPMDSCLRRKDMSLLRGQESIIGLSIQLIKLLCLFLLISLSFSGMVSAKPVNRDFLGRNVKIPAVPVRILSLSPATTEILFSLGLEKNIVGVTSDCNFPAQALKKPKVGKFGFIDIEKVVSLKPDIIFATSDMNKQLDVLKGYKVPLIALNTTNINSVLENISLVGELTHKQPAAKKNRNALNSRIKKVMAKAKLKTHPRVFYCIWYDPLITAGSKSFIGDMIKLSGGENIAEGIKAPFAKYSLESLIAKNPQFIIVPKTTFVKMNLKASPWNMLQAVKNNKVLAVNEDIYLRPGPRIIDALEQLQNYILR
jgi:iron complex transport system substrate-binding protein